MHPVCLDAIAFGVDLHLRHRVIELHILLANGSAAFHWLNTLSQTI